MIKELPICSLRAVISRKFKRYFHSSKYFSPGKRTERHEFELPLFGDVQVSEGKQSSQSLGETDAYVSRSCQIHARSVSGCDKTPLWLPVMRPLNRKRLPTSGCAQAFSLGRLSSPISERYKKAPS